jgi:hypothetical protein
MTEFSLPPLIVGHDSRWIHVPQGGDLDDWVRKATADYLAKNGGHEKQVEALLEGAAEIAGRVTDAAMVLILMPVVAEGVRALVRFCPIDMSAADMSAAAEDAAWSALIGDLTPDSRWEEAPEITQMATKAGVCRRIVRRVVEGEGNIRAVIEHVGYAWLFPQHAAGVLMMTAFTNLAEAGRWRSTLDELAAAVEVAEQAP